MSIDNIYEQEVLEDKVATMLSEHKFYKLALPIVRDYLTDPVGRDSWEHHYACLHAAVLHSNTGNTVPRSMRNRFCEAVIDHYREEIRQEEQYKVESEAITLDISTTTTQSEELRTLAEAAHAIIIKLNQEETKTMTIKVETFTFVNGSRFDTTTDEVCYGLIKTAESQIDKLKAMKTQPKSAAKTISKLEQGIADLVQLMDKRTEDTNDE